MLPSSCRSRTGILRGGCPLGDGGVVKNAKRAEPRGKAFPLKKIFTFVLTAFCLMGFFSCRTMANYDYSHIDANLSQGKYELVREELEKNAVSLYGSHDKVLEALDLALVTRYTGDIQESNKLFTRAEKLMDSYSAKSVSQAVASFFSSDLAQDYAGEDFENIYTNIFMALNYLSQGKDDEAMVEIRRFDNKLKAIRSDYEKVVEQANKSKNKARIEKAATMFYDSVLARYLSLLLYRAAGDSDNARVDAQYLKKAFAAQKKLYDFSLPSSVEKELNSNKTRISVLALWGKAPIKKENVTRMYTADGSLWYQLALPEMTKRPSQITSVLVSARELAGQAASVMSGAGSAGNRASAATRGPAYTVTAEKIESIENIALDTFNQHYSLIKGKALARSVAKAATNSALHSISRDKDLSSGGKALFTMLDISTKVANIATERADVRCSRFFPANASVACLELDEGDWEVTVSYRKGKTVLFEDVQTVSVKKSGLNLLQSVCLR